MNAQKYTQKSLEAIQNAQSIAVEHANQQIEQPHLLLALLQQEGGLIPQLLQKMGVTVESLEAAVKQEVEKLPKVTGTGREADKYYISRQVDAVFTAAEQLADQMKDEFVSVEHLFLAILDHADRTLAPLFKMYRITKEDSLKTLQSVRGNQRVTSDNPEETYDALKKYGTDLVERARQNKLDPRHGNES